MRRLELASATISLDICHLYVLIIKIHCALKICIDMLVKLFTLIRAGTAVKNNS